MKRGFGYRLFDDLELTILKRLVQECLAVQLFLAKENKCIMYSCYREQAKILKRILRTLVKMQNNEI